MPALTRILLALAGAFALLAPAATNAQTASNSFIVDMPTTVAPPRPAPSPT